MQSPGNTVRQTALLLALLSPVAVSDAQVAIQVKNPSLSSTWSSDVQVSSLVPLTFRWRWDGAETPAGVAWQLATVTPTSTATTRATDVIASETGMRLPAKSGVYDEFTVTPSSTWPAKFYIRVRVNVGRKSVYSRWSAVTVLRRGEVVGNPTCTIKGWRWDKTPTGYEGDKPPFAVPIKPGEIMNGMYWHWQLVYFTFKNHVRSEVTYRRELKLLVDGNWFDLKTVFLNQDYRLMDPALVQTTKAAGEDTLKFFFHPAVDWGRKRGMYRFDAKTIPSSGPGSSCSFSFGID